MTTTLLLYLDPGSGSIVIQVVLSTVFATAFFFRGLFGRVTSSIRLLFRGRPKPKDSKPEQLV